jgi:hypothetical protein
MAISGTVLRFACVVEDACDPARVTNVSFALAPNVSFALPFAASIFSRASRVIGNSQTCLRVVEHRLQFVYGGLRV